MGYLKFSLLVIWLVLATFVVAEWQPPSSFDYEPITKYPPLYNYNITNAFCEPLKVGYCRRLGYDKVSLPNLLHEKDQRIINASIVIFEELLKQQCSTDVLLAFICSLYAPKCYDKLQFPLAPCRPLCKKARRSCLKLLRRYDAGWPRSLRCGQFPRPEPYILCLDWKKGKYRIRGNVELSSREKWMEVLG